jgi:hypothetical protein
LRRIPKMAGFLAAPTSWRFSRGRTVRRPAAMSTRRLFDRTTIHE